MVHLRERGRGRNRHPLDESPSRAIPSAIIHDCGCSAVLFVTSRVYEKRFQLLQPVSMPSHGSSRRAVEVVAGAALRMPPLVLFRHVRSPS